MHLFINFMLYFLLVGFSLASAQRSMANLAFSPKSFLEEAGRQPLHQVKFKHSSWKEEFHVMRQTFLRSLQCWSGRWDFFDKTLGSTIQKYAKLEDEGIIKFFEPWFPFGHYVRLNCRTLLDHVVTIQPASLLFMIIIHGFQAAIHRMKMDFEFSFIWLGLFTLITILLWIATHMLISRLKTGRYNHGELVKVIELKQYLLHRPALPKYLLTLLQGCQLCVCFELTQPLANLRVWQVSYARSVVYIVFCFTAMPLFGWLVWGPLISRVALAMSCGFMISEETVLRLQAMVEMHEHGRRAREAEGPMSDDISAWQPVIPEGQKKDSRISVEEVAESTPVQEMQEPDAPAPAPNVPVHAW